MFERLSDTQLVQGSLMSDDIAQLRRAVQVAGISEFDFFRAAWRAWHGAPPDEKRLEEIFIGYLFHQEVPGFIRHFARRVLDAEAHGPLDAEALGLDGLKHVQWPQFYVHPIENLTAVALIALCVLPFV